jgi:SAM-dependent methyltransferase
MKKENKTWFANHSHSWIVILVATALAIVFINWLPDEKIFSSILIGLIVSHAIILLITIFGGWLILPERILNKFRKKRVSVAYDFGWTSKFMKGFGYASFIVLVIAFYSYFTLTGSPVIRFVVFTILILLAVNFFIGNVIAKASQSKDFLILPFVDLFKKGTDKVLDAGCGSGRTTISLGKTSSEVNIIAFDRFDSTYIDDGGKTLFKQNIELAGLSSRVKIEQGDILAMPFSDNYFDASVSSFMFDHLGENKLLALQEMWRVLKPGGRFMLIIMVRSYSGFAIANILSLAFGSRNDWKKLFNQSNFMLVDEGYINFGAYFVIEKPIA